MTTFKWESRQQWGAKPPKNRRYVDKATAAQGGVVIHWPGDGRFVKDPHTDCRAFMRLWQTLHMTPHGGRPGSNDIEYGTVLCHHLILMEGRTERDRPLVRVGSNGTVRWNNDHTSVQLMRGAGDPPPTDAEVYALGEVVAWYRANGWGNDVRGHRDCVSTACPGDDLYAELGRIRRVAAAEEAGLPTVSLKRVQRLAGQARWARGYGKAGRAEVRLIEDALEGEDVNTYRQWQRKLGYTGKDADGVPGAVSLTRLGKRADFTVIP